MSNEVKTVENQAGSADARVRKVEKTYLRPVTDVYRDEDAVRILMDLPGASEEAIDVSVHDGQLTVSAEVSRSETDLRSYERAFRVDRRMDTAQIEATLQNGVLTLRIPFHEEARPKRIPVRMAE